MTIIDPTVDGTWNDRFGDCADFTIFHDSLWATVIKETYGYRPCYVLVPDAGRGGFSGYPFFLIDSKMGGRKLTCLPFTDACSQLPGSSGKIEDFDNLIRSLVKDLRVKSVELRGGVKPSGFLTHAYYRNYRLTLDRGIDELWRSLKAKSIRYFINKARKNNVRVIFETSLESMRIFISLNLMTRKRHGVLPQPHRFFNNVWKYVIDKGRGFVLLAYFGNKAVAASVVFYDKRTLYHKYNASCGQFYNYGANHMIIWRAIQWAVTNSLKQFDFGRTAPENKGLVLFKRHWGTVEEDLDYYYWPSKPSVSLMLERDLKYRIGTRLIRRLPLPVSSTLGNMFYKYFG